MLTRLQRLIAAGRRVGRTLWRVILTATRPPVAPLVADTLTDLVRSRPALVAENALLRQQPLVLRRSVKRPRCTPVDRALLVLLTVRVRAWRQVLVIVQPETVPRWHRQRLRGYRRRRSRAAASAHRPPRAPETVALIREMAGANRLWGAGRIRGEPRKLDIRVARSTIQRHLREARPPRRAGQARATFPRDHAGAIRARDFLPVADLLFRPLFAYLIVALASRRVVHVGVTRHPTDAWAAQPRGATPFGERPRYLIRDNERKYGRACAGVAAARGITELRTAYRAPRQNAACERFLGSVRRECLDHPPILGERHPRRVLGESGAYFDRARPHQGLARQIPSPPKAGTTPPSRHGVVRALPVLGGFHHTHERAA